MEPYEACSLGTSGFHLLLGQPALNFKEKNEYVTPHRILDIHNRIAIRILRI